MLPFDDIVRTAIEAGEVLMRFYQGPLDIQRKEDNSPVTDADLAANQVIVEALARLTPDIPVVSEENAEEANRLAAIKTHRFWLVDPLDGTKGFIKKSGEFTVNIGLIEEGVPVAGVIYVPATDELFAAPNAQEAYKQEKHGPRIPLQVRAQPEMGATVVASLSHRTPETDAFIANIKVDRLISAASSLKFCLVAEGSADIYPRMGRTMEWDTAAGDAILRAAGGKVVTTDLQALRYGKGLFENPHFIAYGKTP